MTGRFDEKAAPPLPREWLPNPQAADADPFWDTRTRTILGAARAELQRREHGGRAPEATAWRVMAGWWRPAAALAAAAATLLLLAGRPPVAGESASGAVLLGLVAAEGDPAAVWHAAGAQVDPVLARIAAQEMVATAPVARPRAPRNESDR